MSRSIRSIRRWSTIVAAGLSLPVAGALAQSAQKIDQEYTAQIKKDLSDPRISTELVDHLPASSTVPTPLKFLGHIVGAPGVLDHAEDIHRYLEAVTKASNAREVLDDRQDGRRPRHRPDGDRRRRRSRTSTSTRAISTS